jgi:hypothetical protein
LGREERGDRTNLLEHLFWDFASAVLVWVVEEGETFVCTFDFCISALFGETEEFVTGAFSDRHFEDLASMGINIVKQLLFLWGFVQVEVENKWEKEEFLWVCGIRFFFFMWSSWFWTARNSVGRLL